MASSGFLAKFFYILRGQSNKLALIVLLSVAVSALDLLGIGLIGPFVAIILDPGALDRFPLIGRALDAVFGPGQQRVIGLGAALCAVFLVKSGGAYLMQRRI